jgi:hypothetical protein
MFFDTIMNIFITLLENVNKSRTSAGGLSVNGYGVGITCANGKKTQKC